MEDDIFVFWCIGEIVGVEQIVVCYFQFGCCLYCRKYCLLVQQCLGQYFGLIVKWCDKVKDLFVMFYVFFQCKDMWIVGVQGVINDDVVFDFKMCIVGKVGFGLDVYGYVDQIGGIDGVIFQQYGFGVVGVKDCFGCVFVMYGDVVMFQIFLQQVICGGVQLMFYQMVYQVDYCDVGIVCGYVGCRFQFQQVVVDDYGIFVGGCYYCLCVF